MSTSGSGAQTSMKDNNNWSENRFDGQLTSSSALSDLIQTFPQDHLVQAFGYGSGVFSQTLDGQTKKHEGMLDLILVVNDAVEFHRANREEAHPQHYEKASWLMAHGSPHTLATWQRRFWFPDAKVLFNVVDDPVPMKYGVIQYQDLLGDLRNWDSLYLAGRLQKPTLPIPLDFERGTGHKGRQEEAQLLVEAQTSNLQSAVATALLLLPSAPESLSSSTVPWLKFYSQIAGLSYTGDFRMHVGGEDPLKVSKLVQAPGQLDRFHGLYKERALRPLEKQGILSISSRTQLEWDPTCSQTRKHLIREFLPHSLRDPLLRYQLPSSQQKLLASTLAAIVAPAARHQSFKGVFSLGFQRSFQYASAKLSKGLFRSR